MKKVKIILLIFIISLNSILSASCWNYREIDKMAIVAGLAIDKGDKSKFKITVEIVETSGGRESKTTSKIISTEGKTIFDAARNMISICGRRLYWSHSEVIIMSREIASEGISKALELYNRDSETRDNVHILISRKPTAKEIFDVPAASGNIKSFEINEMINNQNKLEKAPVVDLIKYDIESRAKGNSVVIPSVDLVKIHGVMAVQVMGAAIIKNDKLIGFLSSDETKDLNFIRDEIKGGIINEDIKGKDGNARISLEIFKNKTIVKPIADGKDVRVNINIDTMTAIDEIEGTYDFNDEEELKKLEFSTENSLKNRIEALIHKVQSKYGADIFGFNTELREDDAKTWKIIEKDWEEIFKNLKIIVNVKINIRNSATLSKPFGEGE